MTSSIVIPVYNQWESYLRAALLSALQQTVPVEIVVVDDGSDEPVQPVVDSLLCSVTTDAEVQTIRQDNGGVAAALNTGLEYAKGEYIQWLSSDDAFRRDKTELQGRALQKVNGMVCYCAYEDGIPQPSVTWPAAQYPSQQALFDQLKQHCFINACTVMWCREALDEIGGFDTSKRHTQDYTALLESAERWNFVALNEPLVRRRTHQGQMLNTLSDPEEAESKRREMIELQERFGVTAQIWLPEPT